MKHLHDALLLAARAHTGQWRAGTQSHIPYLSHPLAVASLALKYGGSADAACAALLHDTPGAQNPLSLAEIREQFGPVVFKLVDAFSDPPLSSGSDWSTCKAAYLEKVRNKLGPEELLLTACEELHDLSELCSEFRKQGVKAFEHLPVTGSKGAVIYHYYREWISILHARRADLGKQATDIITDFSQEVRELKTATFEG